jgi:chain length determinant protein EpsF
MIMGFRQFVLVLRAWWRLAFGIFCGVVIAAVAISVILPWQYTAISSVVIDAKADPVTAGAGAGYTEQLLASYVATEAEIISSERVARRVVKTLKLDEAPELRKKWLSATHGEGDITTWLAEYLAKKKIRVTPTKDSNIIDITVTWPESKRAADVANAFAQAAIETSIELKVEPAKQYAAWFDQRSQALRADLAAKQKRLSDYQAATGIIATDEKVDVESARLAELSTALVAIQAQRQDSQSRQRQLSGNNESLPEVLQSPLIAELKSTLTEAEAKRTDVAGRLGRNHPDYQAAEAEVSSLRARIAQETEKIAASLGSTTQVNMRRESDLQQALEAQKKLVLNLKHKHDEAADLQNDVQTAQRDLDAVTQRLAQSSLESQTQQTNVVQLTYAAPPIKHSSPNMGLNLALGAFVGLILGIGTALLVEMRDPRVREDNDLVRILGLPVLGKIGRINFGAGGEPRLAPKAPRLEQRAAI